MQKYLLLFLSLLFLSSFSSHKEVRLQIDSLYAVLDTSTGVERAHTLYVLGSYLMYYEDYEDAIKYHLSALKICRQYDDAPLECNILTHLYYDYLNFGEIEKALEYNNLLYQISKASKDTANLLVAISNRGEIYFSNHEYDQAIDQFQRMFDLASRSKNKARMQIAMNHIGDAYLQKGDAEKARDYYLRSLDILNGHNIGISPVIINLHLGESYYKLKDYRNAERYLLRAERQAMQLSDPELKVDVSKELHRFYLGRKRLSEAEKYFALYTAFKDSLMKKMSDNKTALEIKNAVMEKETENKLLKKENAIGKLKVEKQHNRLLMLLTGLLGLLTCSALVLMLYIRQRKNYKLLVRQNLEIVRSEKQFGADHWKNMHLKQRQGAVTQQQSDLTEAQKQIILEKLMHALYEKKAYTQQDLTLNTLAMQIDTNRTYLSAVIKEHFDTGFSQLIAKLRVEEARRLLATATERHYTIQHIGKMAGFNSKSAFNSAFKRFTGITPSFFIREIQQAKL